MDARQAEIIRLALDFNVRNSLLAELAAARAQGNAQFNGLLASNGCL